MNKNSWIYNKKVNNAILKFIKAQKDNKWCFIKNNDIKN